MTACCFVTPCWTNPWATRSGTVCSSLMVKKLAECLALLFVKTMIRIFSRSTTATGIGTCSEWRRIIGPLMLPSAEQSVSIPARWNVGSRPVQVPGNNSGVGSFCRLAQGSTCDAVGGFWPARTLSDFPSNQKFTRSAMMSVSFALTPCRRRHNLSPSDLHRVFAPDGLAPMAVSPSR